MEVSEHQPSTLQLVQFFEQVARQQKKKVSTPPARTVRSSSWKEETRKNQFVEKTVHICRDMGYDPDEVCIFAWEALDSHNIKNEIQLVDLVLKAFPKKVRRKTTLETVNQKSLDLTCESSESSDDVSQTPAPPSLLEIARENHSHSHNHQELIDFDTGGCPIPETPCEFGGARIPRGSFDSERVETLVNDFLYDDLDWNPERISVFSEPDVHVACVLKGDPTVSNEDTGLLQVLQAHNANEQKLQQDLFADLVSKYY